MDAQHIEDLPSDPDDVFDEYDDLTRQGTQPQRGPMEDYIGQQLGRFANESLQALSVPIGDPDEASRLRAYLQRFHRGCRKMAFKLDCFAPREPAHAGDASGSAARSPSATRTGSATPGASMTRTGPRRRGKEVAPPETGSDESEGEKGEESTNSENSDPTYGAQDEIGASQLPDAPSPTQGSPRPKRQARGRDRTDLTSGNVLPTNPGRLRRPKKPYTPNPSRRK
ncbi:unnamed protein product [Urochloa humidicola]